MDSTIFPMFASNANHWHVTGWFARNPMNNGFGGFGGKKGSSGVSRTNVHCRFVVGFH
jgi:hypothetical protein